MAVRPTGKTALLVLGRFAVSSQAPFGIRSTTTMLPLCARRLDIVNAATSPSSVPGAKLRPSRPGELALRKAQRARDAEWAHRAPDLVRCIVSVGLGGKAFHDTGGRLADTQGPRHVPHPFVDVIEKASSLLNQKSG